MLPGGGAGPGGDPRAGDAGDFGVGGAGERVELQEVPALWLRSRCVVGILW
jgi:hypothetical protein